MKMPNTFYQRYLKIPQETNILFSHHIRSNPPRLKTIRVETVHEFYLQCHRRLWSNQRLFKEGTSAPEDISFFSKTRQSSSPGTLKLFYGYFYLPQVLLRNKSAISKSKALFKDCKSHIWQAFKKVISEWSMLGAHGGSEHVQRAGKDGIIVLWLAARIKIIKSFIK